MSNLGVDNLYVKIEGTERTEIPVKTVDEKEKEERGINLKIRCFDTVGYIPKDNTT